MRAKVIDFPKFKVAPPGSTIDPDFRERIPRDELRALRLNLQSLAVQETFRLIDTYYPEARSELGTHDFEEYVAEIATSFLGRAKNQTTIRRFIKD